MTTKERNLYELKPDSVEHTNDFVWGYSKWTNGHCAFNFWPGFINYFNSEGKCIARFRFKSRKP